MTAGDRPAGIGFRSERGPVLAALMLSLSLVAVDATVIATAVPTIVAQLGGYSQFPWLFSAYLLTQAVTTPLYGRYADVVGRRPLLLLGLGLFVLGSAGCAVAWSMPALIVGRAVQGLGAGAVQPMVMTIVGDLYTVAERARVQGYIASVWGSSAIVGPLLGGLVVEHVSWRWVFWVNLPLGALAALTVARRFRERVARTEHRIDLAGAVLLVSACTLLILGLLEGGVAWSWTGPVGFAVLVGGAVLLAVFVAVERRVAEPVLPLWVLSRRVLLAGVVSQVGVGVMIVGLSTFVPTFVQNVLGADAVVAGAAVGALSVGWPIAASQSGRVYLRVGFRDTALLGAAVAVAGCVPALRWDAGTSPWQVGAGCFVIGLGMGFASAPVVVAVQSVVGWEHRGVVTSTTMFGRTVGSALGAAVLGAVANAALLARLRAPAGAASGLPARLDGVTALLSGPDADPAVTDAVRRALAGALHEVFVGLLVVAALMALAIAAMPRRARTPDGRDVITDEALRGEEGRDQP